MNRPARFHTPAVPVVPPTLHPPTGNALTSAYPDSIIPTEAPSTAIVLSGQLKLSVDVLYQRMDSLPTIVDQTTFDQVRALVKDASTLKRHVEASRQAAKRPFLDIGSAIDATARPFIERLDLLMSEGKNQERQFLIEQVQQQAAADPARAAAEAAALLDTSRPTAPLVPAVIHQEFKAPVQTRNEVVIVDQMLVPRQYLMLDMAKIRLEALEGVVIPGVEVRKVTDVVAR